MAKLRIKSDGEGQSTIIEIDGKPVDDAVSVVWMVHGRRGKARCIIGHRGGHAFTEIVAERYGDMDVDVSAEVVENDESC